MNEWCGFFEANHQQRLFREGLVAAKKRGFDSDSSDRKTTRPRYGTGALPGLPSPA